MLINMNWWINNGFYHPKMYISSLLDCYSVIFTCQEVRFRVKELYLYITSLDIEKHEHDL